MISIISLFKTAFFKNSTFDLIYKEEESWQTMEMPETTAAILDVDQHYHQTTITVETGLQPPAIRLVVVGAMQLPRNEMSKMM